MKNKLIASSIIASALLFTSANANQLMNEFQSSKVDKIIEQLNKKDLELKKAEVDVNKNKNRISILEELKLYRDILKEYKKTLRYSQEVLIQSKIKFTKEYRIKVNTSYLNSAINKIIDDKNKRVSIDTSLKTIDLLLESKILSENALNTFKFKFESTINNLIANSISANGGMSNLVADDTNLLNLTISLDKRGNIVRNKAIITQGVGIIKVSSNNITVGVIRWEAL